MKSALIIFITETVGQLQAKTNSKGSEKKKLRESGKQASKQPFNLIGLLLIELPKHHAIENYFIKHFSVRQYIGYEMTYLRIVCFHFRTERSPVTIQPVIASGSAGT